MFNDSGLPKGDPVQKLERRHVHRLKPWRDFALLGEIEEQLAHFGFPHLCGRAHEILGKIPDASQVGSDGVGAVAFE